DLAQPGAANELALHVEGHDIGVIAGIPRGLSHRHVSQRHQHAAMDDAAHVYMPLIDNEGIATVELLADLVKRADEILEWIDQLGKAIASQLLRQRAHPSAPLIFQTPLPTISTRSPQTSSQDRKTMVRVRRVTRTRDSITSPSLAGATKSQVSETVAVPLASE